MIHLNRKLLAHVLPSDQKIDFIFDEHVAKGAILRRWEQYIANCNKAVRECYVATPIFGSDEDFLPLQAADLWAWWVRHWYEIGQPERIEGSQFVDWEGQRQEFPKAVIEFNEDALVKNMKQIVASAIEPGQLVYDVRFA